MYIYIYNSRSRSRSETRNSNNTEGIVLPPRNKQNRSTRWKAENNREKHD